jgi:uncharacterized membrane protein
MASIEESIELEVPVRTAYDQWTQFEEFPRFMDGVDEVRQLDDTHLHWKVSHKGVSHEFTTEISEQRPDERIAWATEDGKSHAGVVTFHRLGDERSKVMVQMDWEPEGILETLGQAIGSDDRRVKADLAKFKELIESRGTETGAWRGEVDRGTVTG